MDSEKLGLRHREKKERKENREKRKEKRERKRDILTLTTYSKSVICTNTNTFLVPAPMPEIPITKK